jgi:glucose-1-phosphate thymidylyltransferase
MARHRHQREPSSGSNFIATLEQRQGLKASCIEEIALKRGFIDKEQLLKVAKTYGKSQYGIYLRRIAADSISTQKLN